MKKILVLVLSLSLCMLCGCKLGNIEEKNEQIIKLEADNKKLQREYDDLKNDYDILKAQHEKCGTSEVVTETTTTEETTVMPSGDEIDKSLFSTEITYDNLARTPDKYEGEYFVMSGTVAQVMEDESINAIRLAIDGDYDHMMYCYYDKTIVESRVLENDEITIYGVSDNLITYESTLGGDITIPCAMVLIIEFK